ncbi:hypothetical protein [Roseibium sp. SCP14]|uniref:hypothetical protein n=1 Tax=Roseibium sp. SCP14 TaxID=3141375 RepID=UPI00333C9726
MAEQKEHQKTDGEPLCCVHQIFHHTIKRRTFLVGAAASVTSPLLLSNIASSQEMETDEGLFFERSKDGKTVIVSLVCYERDTGSNNASFSAIKTFSWTLNALAFGPETKFRLFPGGLGPKQQEISGKRARLRLRQVRFGGLQHEDDATGRHVVDLVFEKKLLPGNFGPAWHVSVETTYWSGDLLRLGPGLLRLFLDQKRNDDLIGKVSARKLRSYLPFVFNNLVQITDTSSDTKIDVSFSRTSAWLFESANRPLFQTVTSELRTDAFKVLWERDRDAAQAGASQEVLKGKPAGTVYICDSRGRCSVSPGENKQIEELDLHFHHRRDMHVRLIGLAGQASIALRALELSSRVAGNSKRQRPDDLIRAEAVIAGNWKLSVHDYHQENEPPRAGPFPWIHGVLKRAVQVKKTARFPLQQKTNDQLTFSGILGELGNLQNSRGGKDAETTARAEPFWIESQTGPLLIEPMPHGLLAETKAKEDGKDSKQSPVTNGNLTADPFKPIRGLPVHLVSHGAGKFRVGGDTGRTIDWFELTCLLRGAAVALPDVSYSRLDFAPSEITFLYRSQSSKHFPRSYVWLGGRAKGEDKTTEIVPHHIDDHHKTTEAVPSNTALALKSPDAVSDDTIGDVFAGTSRINLRTATLRASRHSDLAHIKFSFDRLFLVIDADGARIVPEGPLCGIYSKPGRPLNPLFETGTVAWDSSKDAERLPVPDITDSRPVLTVEFPPQHLMEQAIFRRMLAPGPDIDLSRLGEEGIVLHEGAHIHVSDTTAILSHLRGLSSPEKRREFREKVRLNKGSHAPDEESYLGKQTKTFKEYAEKFKTRLKSKLPYLASLAPDQLVYIGPYAMDPDVAEIERGLRADNDKDLAGKIIADTFREVYAQLEILINRSSENKVDDAALARAALLRKLDPKEVNKTDLLAIENYLESQCPLYQVFRGFYRDRRIAALSPEVLFDRNKRLNQEFVLLSIKDGAGNTAPPAELHDKDVSSVFASIDSLNTNGFVVPHKVPVEDKERDTPVQKANREKNARKEVAKWFVETVQEFAALARKPDSSGNPLSGNEAYEETVEARLSEPSRLAFRINCANGLVKARDAAISLKSIRAEHDRQPEDPYAHGITEIPFTFAELTNWAAMELSVVARAERVFAPPPGGRLDQQSKRTLNLHGAAKLDHLRFAPTNDPATRKWHYRAERIASSLRQPPNWNETAIELPARLTLSPSQQALFKAPSVVDPLIFSKIPLPKEDSKDKAQGLGSAPHSTGFVEQSAALWSVSMLTRSDVPPHGLRAVHSPDLAPDAILRIMEEGLGANLRGSQVQEARLPGYASPPRGPIAPWLINRSETGLGDMSPKEFAKAAGYPEVIDNDVCLDPDPGDVNRDEKIAKRERLERSLPAMFAELCRRLRRRNDTIAGAPYTFRTSLDAFDRHELVLLSSAFGLPVMPRAGSASIDETSQHSSQFRPDGDYELIDVSREQEIYRPRELSASELTLTSLGGTFVHDTSFTPPASAKYFDGRNLFDALSIERWQHTTSLGRDIHCEVVYKGFLYPFGFRASLVKVTERIFAKSAKGTMKAYLRQRMFIRCADREKPAAALGQPFSGRRFPGRVVRLLTETTPDIVDPTSVYGRENIADISEHATGRIMFKQFPGLVFWPRTALSKSADVRFGLEIDDVFSTLPLLFVDNIAANEPDTQEALAQFYNNERPGVPGIESPDKENVNTAVDPTKHRRTLVIAGRKLRYADEVKTGSASLQTDALTIRVEGRTDRLNGEPSFEHDNGQKSSPSIRFNNNRYVFDPVLQGADQPPFYPALETARIRLSQNAQLTGKPAEPVRAAYDGHYVAAGFPSERTKSKPEEGENGSNNLRQPFSGRDPAPEEVFLNLIDPVDQDMGNEGDQSGGVYRPKGTLRLISRTKGPMASTREVTFNQVRSGRLPALSLALGTKNPDVNGKATETPITLAAGASYTVTPPPDPRDMLKMIFGNAKLLGLIDFSKIIDLIVTLTFKNVPEVISTVGYGVATVGKAVGEAASAVRQQVLKPLAALVRETNDRWDELGRELLRRQQDRLSGSDIQPITLRELFSEIDRSLDDFDEALTLAEAEINDARLIGKLSAVFETGQRFLDALRRTAANPVERFEIAIEQRIESIQETIAQLKKPIDDAPKSLLAVVKAHAKKELREAIFQQFGKPDEPILSFPLPGFSIYGLGVGESDLTKIRQALTVTSADATKIIDPAIEEIFKGNNPLSSSKVIFETVTLFKEKIEAIKPISEQVYQTFKSDIVLYGDILTQDIEWIVQRRIDRFIEKHADKLTRAVIIYEEVSAYVAWAEKAKELWGQFDNAAEQGNLRGSIEAAEKLLSHVAGQRVSVLEQVKQIEKPARQVRDLAVSVLNNVDGGLFPIGTLQKSLVKGAGRVKCEADSNGKLTPAAAGIGLVEPGFGQPFEDFLAALWKIHSNVVDAKEAWETAVKNDKVDEVLEDLDDPTNAELQNAAKLPGLIDAIFPPAIGALEDLYCGFFDTANELAGLNGRIEELSSAIGAAVGADGTINPDGLKEFKALISEAKRIVAARRAALRLLQQQLTKLLETLDELIKDEENLTLLAAIAALAYLANNNKQEVIAAKEAVEEALVTVLKNLIFGLDSLTAHLETAVKLAHRWLGEVNPDVLSLLDFNDRSKALERDLGIAIKAIDSQRVTISELKKCQRELVNSEYLECVKKNLKELNLTPFTALIGKFDETLDFSRIGERAFKALKTEFEQRLLVAGDPLVTKLLNAKLATNVSILALYTTLKSSRDSLFGKVPAKYLLVPAEPRDIRKSIGGYKNPGDDPLTKDNDGVAADVAWLAEVTAGKPLTIQKHQIFLKQFVLEWVNGTSTPLQIVRQIKDQIANILKGDIDLDELFNIRQQIEAYLLNIIPSKHRFDLGLDFPLPSEVKDATLGIFQPADGTGLKVGAATEIDLLPNGLDRISKPKIRSQALATMGPFDIKLVGDLLDAVTLKFSGARFESNLSDKSNFKLYYDDFVIGPVLEFIQELSSYFSVEGSGAYIRLLLSKPGIEAGYQLSIGTIMIGNVAFSNIGLNASALLPFDGGKDSQALFRASLSSQFSPFTIAYIPFGGSGFFGVIADANGILGFEMSLEFGGAAPFAVGPLTGYGRIMAGFYIKTIKVDGRRGTELSATFYAGGSANIWIFGFSASLYTRAGQTDEGDMYGLALFTLSFSYGLLDFDHTVRFEKRENKGFEGDPHEASLIDDGLGSGPTRFASAGPRHIRLASADEPIEVLMAATQSQPRIESDVICQSCDWADYSLYFDENVDLGGFVL